MTRRKETGLAMAHFVQAAQRNGIGHGPLCASSAQLCGVVDILNYASQTEQNHEKLTFSCLY